MFASLSLGYKLLAIAIAFAVISGVCWKIHDSIWTAGYDKRTAEIEAANKKRDEAAANDIAELEKHYDTVYREIEAMPDSGAGVGPVTSWALDQLPDGPSVAAKR